MQNIMSTYLDVHFINTLPDSCALASFPQKRESRGREPWGLDACLRRHDVLLASDLRNRHLVYAVQSRVHGPPALRLTLSPDAP